MIGSIKNLISRIATSRDSFLGSLHRRFLPGILAIACAITLFSFIIMTMLAPHGLANGDAAIYAQQIENLQLGLRTVHIGYYLIGAAFTRLVPLEMDLALNILSALLGAMSVGLVFSITYTLTGKRIASLISAIVLSTHYIFVNNACFAEVYISQLFFFLLVTQFALLNRPIVAGVSFAFMFLTTPSSILAVPFFVLLRPKRRFLLLSGLIAAVIVTPILAPHMKDFLYGGRGVLVAAEMGVSIGRAAIKEIKQMMGFSFFSVLAATGLIGMFASSRYRIFAFAITILWFFHFILGEKFIDVPVQLPFYSMLAVLAGTGFDILLSRSKRARVAAIALFALGSAVSGSMAYSTALRDSREIDYYRETARLIAETAEPGFVSIGDFSRGVLFEHYLVRRWNTGVWINTEWLDGGWGEEYESRSWAQLRSALREGKQIWLLESPRRDIEALLEEHGYEIEPFRDTYRADRSAPDG